MLVGSSIAPIVLWPGDVALHIAVTIVAAARTGCQIRRALIVIVTSMPGVTARVAGNLRRCSRRVVTAPELFDVTR
jgi:hypothetical protein